MIRNNDFIKRNIGTQCVIVATGKATKLFNGMITVNGTGSFIWECLAESLTLTQLVDKIAAEYDVERDVALVDAKEFVETLKEVGAIAD